jgi:hypothetical protein
VTCGVSQANVAWGDEQALKLLRSIDRVIIDYGVEAPAGEVPEDLRRPARAGTTPSGNPNGSALPSWIC